MSQTLFFSLCRSHVESISMFSWILSLSSENLIASYADLTFDKFSPLPRRILAIRWNEKREPFHNEWRRFCYSIKRETLRLFFSSRKSILDYINHLQSWNPIKVRAEVQSYFESNDHLQELLTWLANAAMHKQRALKVLFKCTRDWPDFMPKENNFRLP